MTRYGLVSLDMGIEFQDLRLVIFKTMTWSNIWRLANYLNERTFTLQTTWWHCGTFSYQPYNHINLMQLSADRTPEREQCGLRNKTLNNDSIKMNPEPVVIVSAARTPIGKV